MSIVSNDASFAALTEGGKALTWGSAGENGVADLTDVVQINPLMSSFCAVHGASRGVTCWGSSAPTVPAELLGDATPMVDSLTCDAGDNAACCALKQDETVDCFGNAAKGGGDEPDALTGVKAICAYSGFQLALP